MPLIHPLVLCRLFPQHLLHRLRDALPRGAAVHVALLKLDVGALSGLKGGVLAVLLD